MRKNPPASLENVHMESDNNHYERSLSTASRKLRRVQDVGPHDRQHLRPGPARCGPRARTIYHRTRAHDRRVRRRGASRRCGNLHAVHDDSWCCAADCRRHMGRRLPDPPASRNPHVDDAQAAYRPARVRRRADRYAQRLRGHDLRSLRVWHCLARSPVRRREAIHALSARH